ncbi:family 65 glycosyl hydrolase domain-containing protein [Persicobacter diffluens]|uniref:Maltose phosphorylase n=1 Tax=Persicobacter diffluens TaxID=981 RepID=A0AAN4VWY4_9BACT|nr:maltose phosphorylase [Persicobacter diffluens]
MKEYIKHHEWNIVEEGFDPADNRVSESLFSLGNGRMGGRGNFEEKYSGDSLLGNYVAGVYYPDKTRVGWWKNGYPEYFAKVLNAANWLGIHVEVDGEELDLATAKVENFKRDLNMKEGYLQRTFEATLPSGKKVAVVSTRLLSIVDDEGGAIRYEVKAVNFSGNIKFSPFVDGDIENEDSNYDEKFWVEVAKENEAGQAILVSETLKTQFQVATGMKWNLTLNGAVQSTAIETENKEKFVGNSTTVAVSEGDVATIFKYICNISSENHDKGDLIAVAKDYLARVEAKGFDTMMEEQAAAWAKKWEFSDILIEGDVKAQQGIRFNIFNMNQTYTGEDARLNIGPKGFTGEKYGGVTYWDTEAYCVPFYLMTAEPEVVRNLLIYRYNHLERAIENAQKLGFTDGAALYPMVTMNGEECHNEWEITFEEIHRNGAIAFAIYNYIRHTGDDKYLADYGFEVLLGITRFWKQRVNWSVGYNKYVMLGVTGPNEFDNNVDNNWYTSYIAMWCMEYTTKAVEILKEKYSERYAELVAKTNFNEAEEVAKWAEIRDNMYLGYDEERNIFIQADGFFNKEQILVKDMDQSQLPIVHHWSWDRILRSNFIKQADVLQGIYLFEERFSVEEIKANYDFYEPRTVHESSLSPCIHSILAGKIGDQARAYEFYLRTSRLDLDDYNADTRDGLHITSMAGTWMAVVEGFAGKRVFDDGVLRLAPFIPAEWGAYTFNITHQGAMLAVRVSEGKVEITNTSDVAINVFVHDKEVAVPANGNVAI